MSKISKKVVLGRGRNLNHSEVVLGRGIRVGNHSEVVLGGLGNNHSEVVLSRRGF